MDGVELRFAIEVENDFEAVFTGVGQALLYAQNDRVPLVVVPEGHVEEPERTMLEQGSGVPIVEVPFDG